MSAALIRTYKKVLELLPISPGRHFAIAESSAGVTQREVLAGGNRRLRQRYLASQRLEASSSSSMNIEKPVVFGTKVKTVLVVRLPEDGKETELVPIDFYAYHKGDDCTIPEYSPNYVPNFRKFWGVCHVDQNFRRVNAEKQKIKALNGDYRIYWNDNDELSENMCIKDLIGVRHVDAARRFWYGDAFIVRFSEHPKTFVYDVHDVPAEVMHWSTFIEVFQDMWKTSFLEEQLKNDQYASAQEEKITTDKGIILQRMYVATLHNAHYFWFMVRLTTVFMDSRSAIERDVLSRLPPNTLEMLAIMACDNGALLNTSIKPCLDNLEMMMISSSNRPKALDHQVGLDLIAHSYKMLEG
jgi:hypothetical protein